MGVHGLRTLCMKAPPGTPPEGRGKAAPVRARNTTTRAQPPLSAAMPKALSCGPWTLFHERTAALRLRLFPASRGALQNSGENALLTRSLPVPTRRSMFRLCRASVLPTSLSAPPWFFPPPPQVSLRIRRAAPAVSRPAPLRLRLYPARPCRRSSPFPGNMPPVFPFSPLCMETAGPCPKALSPPRLLPSPEKNRPVAPPCAR